MNVLVLLLLVHGYLATAAADNCKLFEDGTSWLKSPCERCICSNQTEFCEVQQCYNPKCKEGESLQIMENQCCPVCVTKRYKHCTDDDRQMIPHGKLWRSGCEQCQCSDGRVECRRIECDEVICGPGQTRTATNSSQCCPTCVSGGDTCQLDGQTYRDGESWSPLQCERATCSRGEVVRMAPSCDEKICPAGHQLQVVEGQCCPQCVAPSCNYQGRRFAAGQVVSDEGCRRCVCRDGEVTCFDKPCLHEREECGEDETEVRDGCCRRCRPASSGRPCGSRRDGDLWTREADTCRVEMCVDGRIEEDTLQCAPVACNWNETLVTSSCCPACVPVTLHCTHHDVTYRDGDEWASGTCAKCRCQRGLVQCFAAECTACEANTTAVALQGDCCPVCKPVTCHSSCSTCDGEGFGKCTSCPANRLLQGGLCVRRCSEGFYQHDRLCKQCEGRCARCSKEACERCESPLLLQNGRCVESCQQGFYFDDGRCSPCDSTCKRCSGSNRCEDCYKSHHVVQGGRCVVKCDDGFYFANNTCQACHPSCATCATGTACDTCPVGHLVVAPHCAPRCPAGWFQLSILRCSRCHESCETCQSSTADSCLTCPSGRVLYRGACLSSCPPRHYDDRGVCTECAASCRTCSGSGADQCLSCYRDDAVVAPSRGWDGTSGRCERGCGPLQYVDREGMCRDCDPGCASCDHVTGSCTSCRDQNHVIRIASSSPSQAHRCVTGCAGGHVSANGTLCYDRRRCDGDVSVTWRGECVTSCPAGTRELQVDADAWMCVACGGEGCVRCSSEGKCEKCDAGLALSQRSQRCVTKCEAGFYAAADGRCQRCRESCAECQLDAGSHAVVCTSCREPDDVIQVDECVTSCVPQYYPDRSDLAYGNSPVCKACDWSCIRCSGPLNSQCLECEPGKLLQDGRCLPQCSSGYFTSSDERCVKCEDENCRECDENGKCNFCEDGFYLLDGKCTKWCPRGHYQDTAWQICRSCPAHCLTCQDRDTCIQCDDKTFFANQTQSLDRDSSSRRLLDSRSVAGGCQRRCERGFYGNPSTRRCEKQRKMRNFSVASSPLVVGHGERRRLDDDVVRVPARARYRDNLKLVLVMPATNGWMELNGRRLEAGDVINYRDVTSVYFVHDVAARQPRASVAQIKLRSPGFVDSPKINLEIVAVSTRPPVLTRNKNLIVNTGETVKLTDEYVRLDDADTRPRDVIIRVVNSMRHGKIVKLPDYDRAVESFTLEELRGDRMAYVSGSGDDEQDEFDFRGDAALLHATDGYHVTSFALHVTETSRLSAPSLVTNNVLHVSRSGDLMTRLTSRELLTVAPRIGDKSKIVYVIEPDDDEEAARSSSSAEVVMMVPTLNDAPQIRYPTYGGGVGGNGAPQSMADWYHNTQGLYQSRPLTRITQREVDNGYVWLRHKPAPVQLEDDVIKPVKISVYDESTMPATRIARSELKISYSRDNDEAPHASRNTDGRVLVVTDTSRVNVLHNGYLQYVDRDTSDMDIVYNITRPLSPQVGSIEHADHPYVPLTTFTQADVDANKIIYRPPSSSRMPRSSPYGSASSSYYYNGQLQTAPQAYGTSASPSLPHEFTFTFTVSDGKHLLPPKNFTFQVERSARDNRPPAFIHQYPVLEIARDGTATIGSPQLAIRDPDTSPNDLVFSLLSAPSYGDIIKQSEAEGRFKLNRGDEFTYDDVRSNHLKYTYHGGSGPRSDQFQISVSDGSHLIAKVIQVSISAVDHTTPEPDEASEISLVMNGDDVKTLSRENLAYVDADSADNEIVYHLESTPETGELEHKLKGKLGKGDIFTQSDINTGFIKFTSTANEGVATLTDTLRFHVTDRLGNRLARQVMPITVTPARYLPPRAAPGAPIEVRPGATVPVTLDHVRVVDDDTSPPSLRVVVDMKPSYGVIVRRSPDEGESAGEEEEEEMWRFTMEQVANGEVGFRAFEGDNYFENTTDAFIYHATDGRSMTSEQKVNVDIFRATKPIPVLHVSSVSCGMGESVAIGNETLSVDDVTTPPNQLLITLNSLPEQGRLVRIISYHAASGREQREKLSVGSVFTYQDVIDGKIRYENMLEDDYYEYGEEEEEEEQIMRRRRRDALSFTLSNGFKEAKGKVEIDVEPSIDDYDPVELEVEVEPDLRFIPPPEETTTPVPLSRRRQPAVVEPKYKAPPPHPVAPKLPAGPAPLTVVTNSALEVEAGSTATITSSNLRTTGGDDATGHVTYVVTRAPGSGRLQLIDISNNEIINLTASSRHNSFTQSDINNGFLKYTSADESSTGESEVSFNFRIRGASSGGTETFYINVREDTSEPRMVTNAGAEVREGESVVVTTRHLSATDDSNRLLYDVIDGPELGILELVGSKGEAIESFSEEDLRSGRVMYRHTSEEQLFEDRIIFAVTDGKNSIMQTFTITIIPVDNSLPVVENSGIGVQEGVRKTITEFQLKAVDADTGAQQVTFTVTSSPQHGVLERSSSGRHYLPVTSFSMNDVYDNRISYRHDGSDSLTDRFFFTVNDGTNSQFIIEDEEDGSEITTSLPQKFSITITPVDDGTPRLVTNLGLNYLQYENGIPTGYIMRKSLETEDVDTSTKSIVYTVTTEPSYGHLEVESGGRYQPVSSFTQSDVNAGHVRYVMDVDESENPDVTSDSFQFDVHDSYPNYVHDNSFIIRWNLISFKKATFTGKEEDKKIDIEVVRSGNLNQYAIVLCTTFDGAATSSSSSGADYTSQGSQVQFDEHETEKSFSIAVADDAQYEGAEDFFVELSLPTYSLLGAVRRARVEIDDEADKPIVQFMEKSFQAEEDAGFVSIPIKRSGDLSRRTSVLCYTESRSANSGSDFVGRDRQQRVTFQPGKKIAACEVEIIDDGNYEDSEDFIVKIADPSTGALVGDLNEIKVTINGPNDAPLVFLAQSHYTFYENDGSVDVQVYRSGSDLSFPTDVWCSTKESTPASATANEDFVRKSTKVTFLPQETVKTCKLTIMDDSQTPEVEGDETFVVEIGSAVNGKIAQPSQAVVVINDTMNDVPTVEFVETQVEVKEGVGVVSLEIRRVGDLNDESSVLCFTDDGQASADDGDFVERPETEFSRVVFARGQSSAQCNVTVLDDDLHEPAEHFAVRLAGARGSKQRVLIGGKARVRVTITNDEDAPTLQFGKSEYFVREPSSTEESKTVVVRVVRTGDASKISKVRVSTRDGSAKSGSDYEPRSKVVRFQAGVREVSFAVNIMPNEDTEWHNTFLVVLGPQDPVNAILGDNSQTSVTILDKNAAGSLILPLPPTLVSLLDYDDVKSGVETDPSPGYPLVCVTPCDPKHPDFSDTQSLCEEANINVSSIRFAWEVAMPTEEEDGVPPFERVTDVTPFTSVDRKVLDSIYFGRRFNVRCVAMVVDWVTDAPGTPLTSNVVTIGTGNGLCQSPIESGSSERNSFQAQSCIADLEYVPPGDKKHGNSLHVSVKVPHTDGRLPLISTMPFNNLNRLLSRSIDRHQHVCSNLMYSQDYGKNKTHKSLGSNLGFISGTDYSKLSFGPGFDKPYQFDPTVREPKTIDLYKYLNLKSCVWQFDTYYHMNELIDHCSGKVTTDYQMRDTAESQVTVTVPLYVSYVYVTAPRGWGSLDHRTMMEVNFRYENVLWRTGIQTDGALSGRIQVLRIKIREDGKLVIEFKTQAKFRGLFVVSHRTFSDQKSQLLPPEGMNIGFTLKNVWSEKTYDSPYQIWEAVSTYSRKDYSGEYSLELLPCTVAPTQKWEQSVGGEVQCTAYAPEKFNIPIMFQQTNRPIPVVYTLETKFQLCNNDQVFMLPPDKQKKKVNYDYQGAFTKGQTIYGKVLWSPEQDLKGAYKLQLEKVYLCTGRDGYVPYFDPTGATYGGEPEYGCIEPSKKLKHRFLLLDRSNRRAEQRYFNDVPFDAYFASDKPEFAEMSEMNGVDGFLMKVDALYKVEAGHQWYMQVLYVIGPESMQPRFRRSAMYEFDSERQRLRRSRRDLSADARRSHRGVASPSSSSLPFGDGGAKNGTNMRFLSIDESLLESPTSAAVYVTVPLLTIAALACCLLLLLRRRRRRRKEAALTMTSNVELEAMTALAAKKKKMADGESDEDDDELGRLPRHGNLLPTHQRETVVASPLLLKSDKKCNNSNSRGTTAAAGSNNSKNKRKTCNIKIVDNLHDSDGTEV